jgi:dephospho-CoA kinase
VARLVRARGWSEADARARLAAQRSNQAFAAAADRVIENSGPPDSLEAAAREEYRRLSGR